MAEVVNEFPSKGYGVNMRYLDGQIWKIDHADLGRCASLRHKAIALYQAANRKGLRIRYRIVDGALYVQAVPK